MNVFNGDCLEIMKGLPENSVDIIFCDLPYGQTSCKWDCKIDLNLFWIEVMRIKKLHTPIFFTTTTKFGVELIQSAPKKCYFRYDIVWVKSSSVGFLSAKKMPMRKHEMVYVFYEKLPFYDLSSHKNKFVDKVDSVKVEKSTYGNVEIKQPVTSGARWSPPLPVSVIKEEEEFCKYDVDKNVYGGGEAGRIKVSKKKEDHEAKYDPPLPVSVVKEEKYERKNSLYPNRSKNGETSTSYQPPLPNSILEIKSTRGKHSTEKPVALMEWILKYYSKEGDTCLDPTMGSGSTGIACKNMNREFIGIEMDTEIYDMAVERLNI
tara:strand:+ start:5 stop:961 length:957 start_codon:yes stop_codon:yes gene_type:complete